MRASDNGPSHREGGKAAGGRNLGSSRILTTPKSRTNHPPASAASPGGRLPDRGNQGIGYVSRLVAEISGQPIQERPACNDAISKKPRLGSPKSSRGSALGPPGSANHPNRSQSRLGDHGSRSAVDAHVPPEKQSQAEASPNPGAFLQAFDNSLPNARLTVVKKTNKLRIINWYMILAFE